MRKSIDAQNGNKVNIYGNTQMICVQDHIVSSIIFETPTHKEYDRKEKNFDEYFKTSLNYILKQDFKEFSMLCKDIIIDSEYIDIAESVIDKNVERIQNIIAKNLHN